MKKNSDKERKSPKTTNTVVSVILLDSALCIKAYSPSLDFFDSG